MYLLYFSRNKLSESVTVGLGWVGPFHRFNNSARHKMVIRMYLHFFFRFFVNVLELFECRQGDLYGSRTFHPFFGSPPDGSPLYKNCFHPNGWFTSLMIHPSDSFTPGRFTPGCFTPGRFTPRKVHPPKCSPLRNISNFQGALKLCTKQIN